MSYFNPKQKHDKMEMKMQWKMLFEFGFDWILNSNRVDILSRDIVYFSRFDVQ